MLVLIMRVTTGLSTHMWPSPMTCAVCAGNVHVLVCIHFDTVCCGCHNLIIKQRMLHTPCMHATLVSQVAIVAGHHCSAHCCLAGLVKI